MKSGPAATCARANAQPAPGARQKEDDLGLDRIGVLKLVDEDAGKRLAAAARTVVWCRKTSRVRYSRSSKSSTAALRLKVSKRSISSSSYPEKTLTIAVARFPISSRNAAAQSS